jgi:hypothetical protein
VEVVSIVWVRIYFWVWGLDRFLNRMPVSWRVGVWWWRFAGDFDPGAEGLGEVDHALQDVDGLLSPGGGGKAGGVQTMAVPD